VLVNLIDNAIEYSPAEKPIEIAARSDGKSVTVEVADGGPGLPPGTEQRVFQKFFRAAPEGSRRGIGLGLAISKGIIDAHHGQISASNRPAGGAVFRVSIPLEGTPPKVDASG
jgi:two-component system sensor histidine kinase KdpD